MKKIDKNMKVSNGVLDETNPGFTKKYLSAIFQTELNPFGYENRAEYIDYVKSLGTSELDEHSTKVDVRPVDDKRVQRERLIQRFDEFMGRRRSLGAGYKTEPQLESQAFRNLAAVKLARS